MSQQIPTLPRQIIKRNGMYVDFDLSRVERAVEKCYGSFPDDEAPQKPIDQIVQWVANNVAAKYSDDEPPNVEAVQDIVEMALVASGEFAAAKHYILYREEHAKQRVVVPVEIQQIFEESAKFFPTPLQQFMFFDKYSRFNWELGRRETWIETVDRVVDYLAKLSGGALGFHVYDRIRNAIINMEAMPSMRALAMAGPAAERNSMSIYNCGQFEEKYLTRNGIRTLGETVGTEQTVLNGEGQWVKADIKEFGVQPLQQITFRPGVSSNTKLRHRACFTPDHRWITTNRGEVTDLRVGDRVRFVGAPESDPINEAWIAGFGFGDGTITVQGEAQVRLCGAKSAHLSRFTDYGECGVYYPPSNHGDPTVIFHKGHFTDWKQLPQQRDAQWLASWVEGYLAADGRRAKDGAIHFGSQDNNAIEFVIEAAPLAGYMVTGRSTSSVMETNFGRRKAPLQTLMLRREGEFVVTAIEDLEVEEPVYCAVVPDGHDFVLANGIHTGNCSFMPVADIDAFAEAMLVSLAGCGVGYSVEREFVEQFPRIQRQTGEKLDTHVIKDSAEGWAEAVRHGCKTWWAGKDVDFDASEVRKKGVPLKTKGGRASGPEPLLEVLRFCRAKILSRQGTFLRTLDAHDMMCVVGGAAVSGGVRRTAMICLFDFDDLEMRNCKTGAALDANPWRWNANNSAVWPEDITQVDIVDQMTTMYRSTRGEPGIFSRANANRNKPARRVEALFGSNPCVTGDTWVMTSFGPQQIWLLADRDQEVEVPSLVLINGEPYKTEAFFRTGVKDVFTLATQEGYELQLTADHRVMTPDGWRAAGDLQPGDKLVLNDHGDDVAWEQEPQHQEWPDDFVHGWDEGYLLGAFAGDGTFGGQVHEHALFNVWETDPGSEGVKQEIERAARAYTDRSDVRVRSDWRGWSGPYGNGWHRLSNKALSMLVSSYYEEPLGGVKTIPSVMIEGRSSRFYEGFLRGLFDTDGHVEGGNGSPNVRLSNSDLDLLQAVQRMLLRLGMFSRIYRMKAAGEKEMPDGRGGTATYSVRESWRLVISGGSLTRFARRIGFSNTVKAQKLVGLSGAMTRGPYNKPFEATFAALVYEGEKEVFDVTVPDVHAFDANGFYAHNCGEINLRPWQFCNLTIAVARPWDTYESLRDKVEIATIIGTIQSMATTFPKMRPEWKQNCEEERLLGVDITGQRDAPAGLIGDENLIKLRAVALETNSKYAALLGINPSAAITCVKPNGNSSQFLDTASGLHLRWSDYYIRNLRVSPYTPLYRVLRDAGVPMDPENNQDERNATSWVIHFPVKAPEGALTRKDVTAIDQCEWWLMNKLCWTEHNPSVTITYQPDELLDVMKWVYDHKDVVGGMAFLPADDAQYAQMPYEEITKEQYEELLGAFPEIDFSLLFAHEQTDMTEAASELACSAGVCEIQ